MTTELKTKRLLLRQWQDSDLEPLAKINADPDVMAYYPSVQNAEQSTAMAHYFRDLIAQQGWGFWAVERLSDAQFIGFIGLNSPQYKLPVTPCVEIGWRLARTAWGQGYATEGAKAALNYAFDVLKLEQVYSFTSVANKRSRAVMERLAMHNENCNFEHPIIAKGHSLREHVLYKISNPALK
ncbi:GNAT family N-acetyltransferase [Agaribacterium sp. ZY112]|uniref:GNAT family N-acetyltransferase n=1 Tax=Agaribacterium sp. ZY112 TaxID=3233574 RepID=UPI0035242E7E